MVSVTRGQTGAPDAAPGQTSVLLRQIATAGQLADLRWPDFSDYRLHIQNFYEPAGYALAWVRSGQPAPQALSVIGVLEKAATKGLDPEDDDGSRWPARVARLPTASESDLARFDAALTVCAMRYISDVHIGKVNPKYFHFGLDVEREKYSIPDFVRQRLLKAQDPAGVLATVEPPFPGYKRTQAALARYFDLAGQDDGQPLPAPAKTLVPGAPYMGIPRLIRLLRLLGDLPQDGATEYSTYEGALVDAVKRFQRRHGFEPNGRVDAQTLKCLNTPLSFRVRHMQLTLERWRWLPHEFDQPPIIVNIPEFRLRAYSTDQEGPVALQMNVIVGKACKALR